jgi:hypothetical protein
MTDSFSIIIRSSDRDNLTDNTNDCWIKLKCPSQFKFISCQVDYFYFTTQTADVYDTDIFDLRSDNLNLLHHYDNRNTIAINHFLSNSVASAKIKFTTSNFNNQRIHFQLYDENNILKINDGANYNHPWILILNCTGLNE